MGLTNKTLSPESVLKRGAFDLPSFLEMFIDSFLELLEGPLADDEVTLLLPLRHVLHSRKARMSLRSVSQDFLAFWRPLRTRVPAAFCPLSTFPASPRSSSRSAIRAWRLSVMVAMYNIVLRSDYKGGCKVKKQANRPGPGTLHPRSPGKTGKSGGNKKVPIPTSV